MTTALESSIHHIAELFPPMTAGEYEQMKGSIESVGQLEPIWLFQGRVVDGRARLRACVELGVKPATREHSGNDLAGFVAAQNLHRRHLTPSQRAALAVEILPYLEAEAAARQEDSRFGGEGGAGNRAHTGRARDAAAAVTGANPRYVSDLKKLQQTHPELYDEVKHGPLSVADAQMLTKVRDEDRAAAIELLTTQQARSAREAIELVFAERGEDVPSRILSRPHRDVLIDELRRVLADGVRKADEADVDGALADMRRAEQIARQV